MGRLKYLIVIMPDHTIWRIPALFIAEDRAKYYVEHDGDPSIFDDEVEFALTDEYELVDWANNNMNWSEVVSVAEKMPNEIIPCSYERAWPNAEKRTI